MSLWKKIKQIFCWLLSKKSRAAQKFESDVIRQKVTQYIISQNIEVVCLEFPYMFELNFRSDRARLPTLAGETPVR